MTNDVMLAIGNDKIIYIEEYTLVKYSLRIFENLEEIEGDKTGNT